VVKVKAGVLELAKQLRDVSQGVQGHGVQPTVSTGSMSYTKRGVRRCKKSVVIPLLPRALLRMPLAGPLAPRALPGLAPSVTLRLVARRAYLASADFTGGQSVDLTSPPAARGTPLGAEAVLSVRVRTRSD
jgi:hypothetical protein